MPGVQFIFMRNYLFAFVAFFFPAAIQAQNPIIPPGVYIADPSAHVWKDGRLYVYGSTDESPAYYCSWRHDVLSTTDLKTWTITKNVFASKGQNDGVPYNDALLFAPDVQYKNGTYFLYYCQPDKNNTEGVATSTSPTGPFHNGEKIALKGNNQIDPCVFIDDDGQAYYVWGQFQAKIAKLKPNMKELDWSSFKDNVITEKEHFFHEGGYLIKRKGIYYFVYAHMGRAGMPTCIGYSTAKSPMGPFKYGGVIIDNDHSDPGNWNNHGSLVEFKGQWYVFYHHSTHGTFTMRKSCVEPIHFNKDGSINEVEMTTQGAGKPLSAFKKIDAERACLLYGNLRVEATAADNEALTQIRKNDKAAYKYIDFGNGADSVTINLLPCGAEGVIDVAIDNAWGPSIGSVKLPASVGSAAWIELTVPVKKISGVHAVWLRFNTEVQDGCKVDWFKFIGR